MRKPCRICGKTLYCSTQSGLEQPICQRCRRKLRQRICAQCKRQFDPYGRSVNKGDALFCSIKCYHDYRKAHRKYENPKDGQKANSRARKLNKLKTWDGVPDREIFERADGVCQLGSWCKYPGVKIQTNLGFKDDLAPEIDHIIPFSLGGRDVEANKRAAHRICNILRGNKMTAEETAYMEAHPELRLTKEQLELLPVRKRREPEPKPAPKPPRPCRCGGCPVLVTGKRMVCVDCAKAVNRRVMRELYWTRQGLVPPRPVWAIEGITEHEGHS